MKSKKYSIILLLSIFMLTLAAYSKFNAVYKKQLKSKAGNESRVLERQLHSIKTMPAVIFFLLSEHY